MLLIRSLNTYSHPPSFLPPFTVEAVKAPQCSPTHFPSFPGTWAEGRGGFAVLVMGVQGSYGTASGKVVFFLTNGRNEAGTNPSYFFLLNVDMMLEGTTTAQ